MHDAAEPGEVAARSLASTIGRVAIECGRRRRSGIRSLTKPSSVMLDRRNASASDIRMPVAASRPNKVAKVTGRIVPTGASDAAAAIKRRISSSP
jgi:hypothetical protein